MESRMQNVAGISIKKIGGRAKESKQVTRLALQSTFRVGKGRNEGRGWPLNGSEGGRERREEQRIYLGSDISRDRHDAVRPSANEPGWD
jgi:hypothetical protein